MAEAEHATPDRSQLVAREQRKPAVSDEAKLGQQQAHAQQGFAVFEFDPMDSDEERERWRLWQRTKQRRPNECGKCRAPGAQQLPVPCSRCTHAALCLTCHGAMQPDCAEDAEFAEEYRMAACLHCAAEAQSVQDY